MGSANPVAPENDALARACTAGGSPWVSESTRLENSDAAMLPITAIPRAAPSSRDASFIADPAPARRDGTADMIAAVIGDIDSAKPALRHAIIPATAR